MGGVAGAVAGGVVGGVAGIVAGGVAGGVARGVAGSKHEAKLGLCTRVVRRGCAHNFCAVT